MNKLNLNSDERKRLTADAARAAYMQAVKLGIDRQTANKLSIAVRRDLREYWRYAEQT